MPTADEADRMMIPMCGQCFEDKSYLWKSAADNKKHLKKNSMQIFNYKHNVMYLRWCFFESSFAFMSINNNFKPHK